MDGSATDAGLLFGYFWGCSVADVRMLQDLVDQRACPGQAHNFEAPPFRRGLYGLVLTVDALIDGPVRTVLMPAMGPMNRLWPAGRPAAADAAS
jgi:hypothetical protein